MDSRCRRSVLFTQITYRDIPMTQEEKIKAAYAHWRDDYGLVYEPNYNDLTEADCKAAYEAGYLAAIEDIKKGGPAINQWTLRRDGFTQYVHLTNNPLEFPEWDVTPFYRLED